MPSLILERPKYWDQVVGQEATINVLTSILTKGQKILLQGWIFEGVHGVGKTTTGYIFARALMCLGDNPLGCLVSSQNKCTSCDIFDSNDDHDIHPDFTEIDAASHSGVADARDIANIAESLPNIGKRRVILIDETHRLSRDAWDVYLKPLEKVSSSTIFIFVTNDPYKIPKTVRSRVGKVRFYTVTHKDMVGFLANVSSRYKFHYDLEGIKLIARHAKGHIRDAIQLLNNVSTLGKIDKESVRSVIDTSVEDLAQKILVKLVLGEFDDAIESAIKLAAITNAPRAVEILFASYAQAIVMPEGLSDEEAKLAEIIRKGYNDYGKVSQIFLKWSGASNIPADVIPILIYELRDLVTKRATTSPRPMLRKSLAIDSALQERDGDEETGEVSVADMAAMLGARQKK